MTIERFQDLMMLSDLEEYIRDNGADDFLKHLAVFYPATAHALTSAVLHEHAHDYDKKKAALLRGHQGG